LEDKVTLFEYGVYLAQDGTVYSEKKLLEPDKWVETINSLDPFYENTILIETLLKHLGRLKEQLDTSLDTYF
jgi:hypothetical protein|tara:strand:+ start:432 stop:647 length:216 start_codon:yes stop_codon:yes gene_type:complete